MRAEGTPRCSLWTRDQTLLPPLFPTAAAAEAPALFLGSDLAGMQACLPSPGLESPAGVQGGACGMGSWQGGSQCFRDCRHPQALRPLCTGVCTEMQRALGAGVDGERGVCLG